MRGVAGRSASRMRRSDNSVRAAIVAVCVLVAGVGGCLVHAMLTRDAAPVRASGAPPRSERAGARPRSSPRGSAFEAMSRHQVGAQPGTTHADLDAGEPSSSEGGFAIGIGNFF